MLSPVSVLKALPPSIKIEGLTDGESNSFENIKLTCPPVNKLPPVALPDESTGPKL